MDNLRGIIFMLLAMAGFSIEDGLIKSLTKEIPVSQILILLGIGGTIMFVGLSIFKGDSLYSPNMRNKVFVIRFVSDVLSPLFFLTALALIPLSTAASILQTIPILVTMGAALVLGQKVGWRRWSAIGVGFCGVLLIVRPGSASFEPASILALLGVTFLASRDLATRVMPSGLSTFTVTAYAFGASIIAGILLIPFFGQLIWPTAEQWLWLLVLTVLGGLSYAAIVVATRAGDVAVIAPFRYSRLVFSLVIAVAFLGERPDWQTLAGATIIILSGLYTFWREQIKLQQV
jgi:drug/metabolite transporter (DMT)-like permease